MRASRTFALVKWAAVVFVLLAMGPATPGRSVFDDLATEVRHAPMQPLGQTDGTAMRGSRNVGQSTNWSGYVVQQAVTGTFYTAVQGSWIVPSVSYGAGGTAAREASSSWVGIGACGRAACGTDGTLIQLGTEQEAFADGTTRYHAWYEMLPESSIPMPNPVNPGDVMTGSVQCVASCTQQPATWVLSLVDQTAGWTFTQTFVYASSELSAEWIQEAPTSNGQVLPLSDFGRATFSAMAANGVGPSLDLNDNGIDMRDALGQTSSPSVPVNDAFSVCWNAGTQPGQCGFSGTPPQPAPQLAAAVLPSSRSVGVFADATAFATIINPGSTPAESCTIQPVQPVDEFSTLFSFQTTDPATNSLTGTPNTPVTIPAHGSQSFVISLTSVFAFAPKTLQLSYTCQGQLPAAQFTGINTLLISVSETPVPDMIALVATASNDGTLHIAGNAGIGAFAMASDNAGANDTLTVTANTGAAVLPVGVTLCQTDPATSRCLAPPSTSVSATIAAGAQPTFSVFATANAAIPFLPANNRIFIQFTDSSGTVRGSTSVAVTTE